MSPEDEDWMYADAADPEAHMDDGLGAFLLTMDPADIDNDHPLNEKPEPLFTNALVMKAFWECNGFRDGNGGAIMPDTIDRWIQRQMKGDGLTPEQILDIEELVPVADLHWRLLQNKKLERERNRGG